MASLRLTLSKTVLSGLCLLGSAKAGDVVITLTDGRAGGTVYVSLTNETQFQTEQSTASEMFPSFEGGHLTVTFKDIAAGEYAFSVWHDLNDNQEFDMNAFGMPEDGFSAKGVRSLFGPPTWASQKFTVGDDKVEITEPFVYFGN